MKIKSSSFKNEGTIPKKYTCEGSNVNPSLEFLDIPEKTKSLALIIEDPDAPNGTFNHWVLWNINPKTSKIRENSVPKEAIQGKNDFGKNAYGGPCPPDGKHRYFFKLFALNKQLEISENSNKNELLSRAKEHIITQTELMGTYEK